MRATAGECVSCENWHLPSHLRTRARAIYVLEASMNIFYDGANDAEMKWTASVETKLRQRDSASLIKKTYEKRLERAAFLPLHVFLKVVFFLRKPKIIQYAPFRYSASISCTESPVILAMSSFAMPSLSISFAISRPLCAAPDFSPRSNANSSCTFTLLL